MSPASSLPTAASSPGTEGLKQLQPGASPIASWHGMIPMNRTGLPHRRSVWLFPVCRKGYGYLSEHHAYGETEKKTGEYAEDLAATMLATTLGIEFDVNAAWSEREQIYKASGKISRPRTSASQQRATRTGSGRQPSQLRSFCKIKFPGFKNFHTLFPGKFSRYFSRESG